MKKDDGKARTSITLKKETLVQLKILAAQRWLSLNGVMEDAIELYLKSIYE